MANDQMYDQNTDQNMYPLCMHNDGNMTNIMIVLSNGISITEKHDECNKQQTKSCVRHMSHRCTILNVCEKMVNTF